MEELKKQSVFMQMHNGVRPNEGSFNVGLQKLFYLAGISNRRKLVEAFPEFFGEEVPEFGIQRENSQKGNFTESGAFYTESKGQGFIDGAIQLKSVTQ